MPLTPYMAKQLLDYLLGGAAATRPASRFISFATGTPDTAGASDGPINARESLDFAAANSGAPFGSATIRSARSNATATLSPTCKIVGWNMWDSAAGGTRLAYGTFSGGSTFTVTNVGSIIMSAGRLVITIQ